MAQSCGVLLLGVQNPQSKGAATSPVQKQLNAEEAALFGGFFASMVGQSNNPATLPQWQLGLATSPKKVLKQGHAPPLTLEKKLPDKDLQLLNVKLQGGGVSLLRKMPMLQKTLPETSEGTLSGADKNGSSEVSGNLETGGHGKSNISGVNAAVKSVIASIVAESNKAFGSTGVDVDASIKETVTAGLKGEVQDSGLQQLKNGKMNIENNTPGTQKMAATETVQKNVAAALQARASKIEKDALGTSKMAIAETPLKNMAAQSQTGQTTEKQGVVLNGLELVKDPSVKSANKLKHSGRSRSKHVGNIETQVADSSKADPNHAARAFKQHAGNAGGDVRNVQQQQAGASKTVEKIDSILAGISENRESKTSSLNSMTHVQKAAASQPFVLRDAVVEQIRPVISRMILKGDSKVTLSLKPQSLGQVQIEVESIKGLVEVRFVVESVEVKTLINQSLPELKLALMKEGLDTGSVNIDLSQQSSTNNGTENRSYRYSQAQHEMQADDERQHDEDQQPRQHKKRDFGYNSMELEA
ncbi:flagellar hook-length control protein FliK [bacterium]|nr:flagellar hook-length control protein FliK [bacterium]